MSVVDTVKLLMTGTPEQPVSVAGVPMWKTYTVQNHAGIHSMKRLQYGTLRGEWSPESGLVKFEYSVPKLLFGSNVREAGAADVQQSVRDLQGMFGVQGQRLLRCDLCRNRKVPDVPGYLSELAALGRAAAPGRWKMQPVIGDTVETVWFRNGSRQVRAYNKWLECGEEAARGIVREEYACMRNRVVKAVLGTDDAFELTDEGLRNALSVAFASFPEAMQGRSVVYELIEAYGVSEGLKLVGFMEHPELATGLESHTKRRYEKKINEVLKSDRKSGRQDFGVGNLQVAEQGDR